METKSFLTSTDVVNLIKDLSKSQGFYGRLLEQIKNFSEDQMKEFSELVEKEKFSDPVDVVLFFEI